MPAKGQTPKPKSPSSKKGAPVKKDSKPKSPKGGGAAGKSGGGGSGKKLGASGKKLGGSGKKLGASGSGRGAKGGGKPGQRKSAGGSSRSAGGGRPPERKKAKKRAKKKAKCGGIFRRICGGKETIELTGTAAQAVDILGLNGTDLRRLKFHFDDIDMDGSGEIDYDEFFDFVHEKRSPLTDALFKLIGACARGRGRERERTWFWASSCCWTASFTPVMCTLTLATNPQSPCAQLLPPAHTHTQIRKGRV